MKQFLQFTSKLIFTLAILLGAAGANAQTVYLHNFGTTAISAHPYTVAPVTLAANLTTSGWTNSNSAWTSFAGSSGLAISLNNSSGTPTITLSITVGAGYTLDITDYSFWRRRSAQGAQNWSMTIDGAAAGSGTVPTTGANTGTISSSHTGLSGTFDVVLSLSGASGTGTFRLDDFTLIGTVNSAGCAAPATQASAFTFSSVTGSSMDVSWTNGSGAGRVVYMNTVNSFTDPATGANPAANTTYGGGQQCVFNGTGSGPISISGLASSTTYWFRVYEY